MVLQSSSQDPPRHYGLLLITAAIALLDLRSPEMDDSGLLDIAFAKEREEYKSTTEGLLEQLGESERDRILAVEQMMQAEERRVSAEEDLHAQIQKATEFEARYYEEWGKRKSIEEELVRCKEELEKAKTRAEYDDDDDDKLKKIQE